MNSCLTQLKKIFDHHRLIWLGVWLGGLAATMILPAPAFSQAGAMGARERLAANARAAAQQNRNRLGQEQDAEEEEIGPPEDVSLTTKDNVLLRCTYYPGIKSKTTVALIMLHDWGGNRKDLKAMSDYLHQNNKYSIIVPDLRGHGESVNVSGSDKPLDYKRFNKDDVELMQLDIEECKKFLMDKNDLGELNIEMLAILTVGKMAAQAVQWSVNDWKWEPIGGIKQGKDVKAILMISPERKLKGMSMAQNLKTNLFTGKGATALAVYLAWAQDDETADREGKSISNSLEKSRSKLSIPLFQQREPYNTDLTGTGLVANPKHKIVFNDVATFIEDIIVKNKDVLPWQNREKK